MGRRDEKVAKAKKPIFKRWWFWLIIVIVIAGAVGAMLVASAANARDIKSYYLNKNPVKTVPSDQQISDGNVGRGIPNQNVAGPVTVSFEVISLYDTIRLGCGFIPPDTMGAVGGTQYFETSNGAYAVYDKFTGAQHMLASDVAW